MEEDTCILEWSLPLSLAALLLAGCVGTASELPTGGNDDNGSGGGGGGGGIAGRPEVVLPASSPRLLPFDVRLKRVASAVGVSVDDAVFDAARTRRLSLGAHDFANGTSPDLQWNSQRIAVWIEAMLPVCGDTRVRSSFNSWASGGVEKFTQSALGRPSTAGDLDDLSAPLAVSGDAGWVATCLALMSSAEMVYQ